MPDTEKNPLPPKPVVFAADGKALANSRDVATHFGKAHGHVMRSIRNLLSEEPRLGQSNFGLTMHADSQGKAQPTFDMDRTGFSLLALGFTGSRALKFRIAYVEAFDAMEAALRRPREGCGAVAIPERSQFPDWPLPVWRAKNRTANLYLGVFGVQSAQWAMVTLGFPMPPKPLVRQLSLMLNG